MERRRRVLLIDAVEGDVPGIISVCANPRRSKGSSTRITSRPPPCLRCSAVTPTLHDTEFIWILVTVNSARWECNSPGVAAAIPQVVERVRQELGRR